MSTWLLNTQTVFYSMFNREKWFLACLKTSQRRGKTAQQFLLPSRALISLPRNFSSDAFLCLFVYLIKRSLALTRISNGWALFCFLHTSETRSLKPKVCWPWSQKSFWGFNNEWRHFLLMIARGVRQKAICVKTWKLSAIHSSLYLFSRCLGEEDIFKELQCQWANWWHCQLRENTIDAIQVGSMKGHSFNS